KPPCYVPIAHRYLGAPSQLPRDAVVAALAPALASEGVKKTIHDVKQARLALEVPIEGPIVDPMLAAYLLDPGAASYGVNALSKRLLHHAAPPAEGGSGKGPHEKSLAEADVAAATRFGGERVDVAQALGKLLAGRVAQAGMGSLMNEVELPLARVLGEMERHGILVDVAVLRELGQKVGEECQRLERQIQEI